MPIYSSGDVTPAATSTVQGKVKLTGGLAGTADSPTVAADTITNAMLDTASGELGGAWTSWEPNYNNFTETSGTHASAYSVLGKICRVRIAFTWGASSSHSGGSITFPLPVTASSSYKFGASVGTAYMENAAVQGYWGQIVLNSTTVGQIIYYSVSGSTITQAGIAATAPFSWGTGDFWSGTFMYETA